MWHAPTQPFYLGGSLVFSLGLCAVGLSTPIALFVPFSASRLGGRVIVVVLQSLGMVGNFYKKGTKSAISAAIPHAY